MGFYGCVGDDAEECSREDVCVTYIVWKKINPIKKIDIILTLLLKDLLIWYKATIFI